MPDPTPAKLLCSHLTSFTAGHRSTFTDGGRRHKTCASEKRTAYYLQQQQSPQYQCLCWFSVARFTLAMGREPSEVFTLDGLCNRRDTLSLGKPNNGNQQYTCLTRAVEGNIISLFQGSSLYNKHPQKEWNTTDSASASKMCRNARDSWRVYSNINST